MHVGHLRTTIVGDASPERWSTSAIASCDRTIWRLGTPFGMLIEHLLDVDVGTVEAELVRTDPSAFYQAARAKFAADQTFATQRAAAVYVCRRGKPRPSRSGSS